MAGDSFIFPGVAQGLSNLGVSTYALESYGGGMAASAANNDAAFAAAFAAIIASNAAGYVVLQSGIYQTLGRINPVGAIGASKILMPPMGIIGQGPWETLTGMGTELVLGYNPGDIDHSVLTNAPAANSQAITITPVASSGGAAPTGAGFANGDTASIYVGGQDNWEIVKATATVTAGNLTGFTVTRGGGTGSNSLKNAHALNEVVRWPISNGKIVLLGAGKFTIADIGLAVPAATNDYTPVVYVTNTQLRAMNGYTAGARGTTLQGSGTASQLPAVQTGIYPTTDGFVFGGTGKGYADSTAAALAGTLEYPYNGENSFIQDWQFNFVRRYIYGRCAANAIKWSNLFGYVACGNPYTYGGAIEFDGTCSDTTRAGTFSNGQQSDGAHFEIQGYQACVTLGPYTAGATMTVGSCEDDIGGAILTAGPAKNATSITTDRFLPRNDAAANQAHQMMYYLDSENLAEKVTVNSITNANTTTMSAAAAGATAITVAVTTGIAAGVYLGLDVGNGYGTAQELALCQSIAGSVVTLTWPLQFGHGAGAPVRVGPFTLGLAAGLAQAHASGVKIGSAIAACAFVPSTALNSNADGGHQHEVRCGLSACRMTFLDTDVANSHNKYFGANLNAISFPQALALPFPRGTGMATTPPIRVLDQAGLRLIDLGYNNTQGLVGGVQSVDDNLYLDSYKTGGSILLGSQSNCTLQTGTGIMEFKGRWSLPLLSKGANYTILAADAMGILLVTASTVTITLPSRAALVAGQVYYIKNAAGVTGTVLATQGGATIDGNASPWSPAALAAAFGSIRLYTDGTTWYTF